MRDLVEELREREAVLVAELESLTERAAVVRATLQQTRRAVAAALPVADRRGRGPTVKDSVVVLLRGRGPTSVQYMVETLGVVRTTLSPQLSRLVRDGSVVRVGRNLYQGVGP